MDLVLHSGEPVLITKHGKPVVRLVPAERQADEIFGYPAGKVKKDCRRYGGKDHSLGRLGVTGKQ
jgi:antitoxin (DNA-binding transcriptional repressor) of toxin-antitoxin stability system